MYTTSKGSKNLKFNDTFAVNIEPQLFEQHEIVSNIIDNIFNLDEVLVATPSIVSNGCPVREQWITIKVETKPIDNSDDAMKFSTFLMEMEGVHFAFPIIQIERKTSKEIVEQLYGGKRSKL